MAVRVAPEVGTPEGRLAATRAGSLAQRLLTLDDLWTAERAQVSGETASEPSLRVVDELVSEMSNGLEELVLYGAYDVRMMLAELSDASFEGALEVIADLPSAPPDMAPMLSSALPDFDARGAVIAACDYIREKAGAEAELLRQKQSAIHHGEAMPGDFRPPFRCAASMLVIGAGVAATIGTAGAAGFVALGVGAGVGAAVLEWVDGRCAGLLPEISFHRR